MGVTPLAAGAANVVRFRGRAASFAGAACAGAARLAARMGTGGGRA
jgi:hypothetical protein